MRVIFATFFLLFNTPLLASSYLKPNEIRLGVLKHDIKSGLRHHHEKGFDGNVEFLWKKLSQPLFKYILSPRPHLGASINFHGRSHQFYTGLTWRYDAPWSLFIEASLGGELHTGKLSQRTNRKKNLGTQALFRESISIGIQLGEQHSLSLTLDHASNASLAKSNPGLTGFGIRYGVKI